MSDSVLQPKQHSKRRGGKLIPALCNVIGTLILLSVIASCALIVVPRFLGYDVYNVVSGSMAPEIPIGSVIYVESVEPETVQTDDVIAFRTGDSVTVHRVVVNQTVEGEFTTKGDANAKEDINSVPYDMLIGRVKRHYPMVGSLLVLYTSNVGKIYAICFAACGAMLNMLASRLRARRRYAEKE